MGKRTRRNLGTRRRRCAEEGRGGERGREEGETREEPRCSGLARGGLRLLLLAALRQLGGVRRGIEIANAHYGYFPIEGRIPLSLSLSPPSPGLLPGFSLFLLPLSFPRSLSSSFLPFTSLHRFHLLSLSFSFSPCSLFIYIARSLSRCSSSYRIFSYPLILPRDFFLPLVLSFF